MRVFSISEKVTKKSTAARTSNSTSSTWPQRSELTPESVGARPGNVLVPISNYHALYHLAATLDRVKVERRDIVVLHVRLLRRSGSGESELEASQLFGSVEQYLFTKALSLAEKRGKTIRLAVVSATDLWDGILRAGVNLHSSTLVLGGSTKVTLAKKHAKSD